MTTIKAYRVDQAVESGYQRELINLRIAVARLAQAAKVETEDLPVLRKPYDALYAMASNNVRGWHRLILRISDVVDPITVTPNQGTQTDGQ